MNRDSTWRNWFSLNVVNKKILLLSKLVVIATFVAYSVATAISDWKSDIVFISLVFVIVMVWDRILYKTVAAPIKTMSQAAQRMADLDFSRPCKVSTKDELQTMAENLNATSENLQRALAQRKELTDTLSHELKTPLGVIRAYTEGLETSDMEIQSRYRQVILEEVEKMTEMIHSLLDLSAMEAGATPLKMEVFDLVELTETVAGKEFLMIKPGNQQIDYSLPTIPIKVMGDSKRIRQVLHNLMGNAKKFASEEGIIYLRISTTKEEATFSIYNDGSCLSKDVWKKFHREKSEQNRHGTGLGLAIAAQILRLHKAKFGFDNKERGVEFYFTLRIAK